MYGLVVRFELRPGHEEAFDALVSATLRHVEASEPATLCYVSHVPGGAPGTRIFYEVYEDEAAFSAHETSPHVVLFLAEREQHLAATPEVWRLVSGSGMVRDRFAAVLG